MGHIKSFLHQWCAKHRKEYHYHVKTTGPQHRQHFFCELRVSGFDYVGAGNSTNKKDAQENAAKDYVNYLVRMNCVNLNDVRRDSATLPDAMGTDNSYQPEISTPIKSVFQGGMGPNDIGQACRPHEHGHNYMDRLADQKRVENVEDVDVNPGIQGNWTIENLDAKSKLHHFMQDHKINADYKYTPIGPEYARSFIAEMSFYVKQLGQSIIGREIGSNKRKASQSCALSIVRQLYHLGVIEPFSSTKSKSTIVKEVIKNYKTAEQMKPYPVKISSELESEIQDVLVNLDIKPIDVKQEAAIREECSTSNTQGVSLLTNQVLDDFIPFVPQPAGVVSWSPPQQNWNPWTGRNIDVEPLASTSLDQLSENLMNEQREKLEQDDSLLASIEKRCNMPVHCKKNEIMNAIKQNSVIIIRGTTGCGKTTQVCQIILDDYIASGQGAYCTIVVTQPKRISAVSVADRVATERCETLGQSIGYSVRFESCLPRPYASVMFCTSDVLLRKLECGLKGVSHVIVDEIHERDINTDFIMVVLRDMIHLYPDLRIILMSATIDTTLFSEYFNNSPVVDVPGILYPVKQYFLEDCIRVTHFTPPTASGKRKSMVSDDLPTADGEPEENLNKVIGNKYSVEVKNAMAQLTEKKISFELIEALLIHITTHLVIPGTVLIFLPGWDSIYALIKHFHQHPLFGSSSYRFIPLYSQIPIEDLRTVFGSLPVSVTKIILSTNIAETSITIRDVVYVIDSCKNEMKQFTSHSNTAISTILWASKTNLDLRKDRAGCVRPGFCFHLCSKARFQKMDEHMTPEMCRTPLYELALIIKLLKLGNIRHFLSKAIEPPPIDAVIKAEVMLGEIKCLDKNDELTHLGKILARLSIEPRLGKMMILGCIFRVGDALSTMVANNMTFPYVYNIDTLNINRLSVTLRLYAGVNYCDHNAMFHVFRAWDKGSSIYDSFVLKELSVPGLRITLKVKNQLQALLQDAGFPEETLCPLNICRTVDNSDPRLDTVAALLCMGLYPNVCVHKKKCKVLTMESKTALIHKASVNHHGLNFPFPFFVFRERIRTRAAESCKRTTMVSPIHLLLFGSCKVEYVDGVIRLDDWINLDMNPQHAAAIVALRPALENLVVRVSKDPRTILELSPTEEKVLNVIKSLCIMCNACYHEVEQITGHNFQSRPPREHLTDFEGSPAKMMREDFRGSPFTNDGRSGDDHFGNSGGYSGR